MHLPECHFKVAELKMHLRSLVPGAVSRRGGVGGCAGGRGGWMERAAVVVVGGGLCLLSGASGVDPWRVLKMGL